MHKIWHDEAWADYLYWQTQDKKTLNQMKGPLDLPLDAWQKNQQSHQRY